MAGKRKKPHLDQFEIKQNEIQMDEESVPLHFSNIARMHSDPIHTTIVFGYLRPGKLNEYQAGRQITAEVEARVAIPTETLIRLYELISNTIERMKKDGIIEIASSSPEGKK